MTQARDWREVMEALAAFCPLHRQLMRGRDVEEQESSPPPQTDFCRAKLRGAGMGCPIMVPY